MVHFAFTIILVFLCKVLPHPANVTPIISIGLFSCLFFKNNKIGPAVFLCAMLISDIYLGLYASIVFNYVALFAVTLVGRFIVGLGTGLFYSVVASFIFFIISNFGVFLMGGMYHASMSGLIQCYLNAIPFFIRTLSSTLLTSLLLSFIYFPPYPFRTWVQKKRSLLR